MLVGAVLGVTLGVPSRFSVLFAALGLAVGWVGFTGTNKRLSGGGGQVALRERSRKVTHLSLQDDTIFKEEARRKWLDEFLLKQQQK